MRSSKRPGTQNNPLWRVACAIVIIFLPILGFAFGMQYGYITNSVGLKQSIFLPPDRLTQTANGSASPTPFFKRNLSYAPTGEDDSVWYIDETIVETKPLEDNKKPVRKYIKLSFPRNRPTVSRIESRSFNQPFIIYTKTDGCSIDTKGGIGKGGGEIGSDIFNIKLGDLNYRYYAWSRESTFTAYTDDWLIQFAMSSPMGKSNPKFNECIDDYKQILPYLKAEYIPNSVIKYILD